MRTRKLITRTAALSVAPLLSLTALAQETAVTPESAMVPHGPDLSSIPVVQANVSFVYDGGSSTKFEGVRRADSDSTAVNAGVDTRIMINDDWFVPIGLQSDNYFLGTVGGEPIPDDIHTLHLRTGLGYRLNDKWTFTGLLGPSLLRVDNVHSDDVSAFGGFLATYRQSMALTWTFGFIASPDNDIPALPVVGVRWLINDKLTLEAGVPKTRLTYHFDPIGSLYAGLDMSGSAFRSSDNLGTRIGDTRYNNALATYRDIRIGVGTGFNLCHALRAEVEAGYSVYRRIDYSDINQEVDFKPAPYVRAGLSYRF